MKHQDEKSTECKPPERSYAAASASGASHEKGQTLLPMLIAGLILIFVGMLAVVVLVQL